MKSIREQMVAVLGAQATCDDPETLHAFARRTPLISGKQPLLVLRPRNTQEVQQIVRIANEEGINLIPSSSGLPKLGWGSVPAEEGMIVDLSRMKRIIRLDRRNRVSIVEPGVTFAELGAVAAREGLKVLMPLLPRKTKSVLASYLEREPILIPKYHWDMTDPLLCAEVVYGSGEILRTGSSAGPGSLEEQWKAGNAQKNPFGPGQTDFLRLVQGAQGTMGIVTWASVKLEVLPTLRELYLVPAHDLEHLIEFAYKALRRRLGDELFLLNGFTLASLSKDSTAGIRECRENQWPWTLIISMAGYGYFPEKRLEFQRADIGDLAHESGLEIRTELSALEAVGLLDILRQPSRDPYWKLSYKGACHDVFFLTTLDRTPKLVSLMQDVLTKHHYPQQDLGVYLQPVQHGRSCHCEFQLPYRQDDLAENEQVRRLSNHAARVMVQNGAFFSRPHGDWAQMVYPRCSDTVDGLKTIKRIFDPNNVLNRGRLCFQRSATDAVAGL
jgi:hypothetical protein